MRDLAAKIGVSRATVSMALRNHPRLSEETRKRVQAEAAKLGYKPNALVSALMTQVRGRQLNRSGEVLAFLTAYTEKEEWQGAPTVRACFEGARTQAEQLGYRLEPYWLGPLGAHSAQVSRTLRARAVRGSILAPVPLDLGPVDLRWGSNLVVAIGYSFRQQALHRVTHNQFNGMLTCYERLRALGHKRIGLAMHREADERVHHYWMAGFYTGRQVHGGASVPMLFQGDWHNRPQDRVQFLDWFAKNTPDAIIGILPDLPLKWLKAEGVKVPSDVSYAGLDLDSSQVGKVAGVRQHSESIGAAAVDLVAGGLQRNDLRLPAHPQLIHLDGEWCEGQSMAAR
ncbi:MAG: LacI family DNA-binding transcriptional regulator [Opitutaceae bacterium]